VIHQGYPKSYMNGDVMRESVIDDGILPNLREAVLRRDLEASHQGGVRAKLSLPRATGGPCLP